MTKKALWLLLSLLSPLSMRAQPAGQPVAIRRATAPIVVDGNVSAEEWGDAARVDRWVEFNPGDNVEPKVASVGYLAYDDRFLYLGFVFSDPEPSHIRAPYTDRDNLSNATDYGGVLLSPSNDGKTAVEFLASPAGIQYDAIQSDTSGEDSSPDYYWDSAGRITPTGWMLEIRIPFSSLRYEQRDPQTWGIILYRNYPRDRRYQISSVPVPKGANCFICNAAQLTGLAGLPSASHLIVAPYATARHDSSTAELGEPLQSSSDSDAGVDAKWTPNTHLAIDATINPDFSQIESDATAITANERFAIFYPEKRPFFLEGKDLFETPIQAVYTRTINSPRWGGRATGSLGNTAYTVLVADDRGGGSVILPGANYSRFARLDFQSTDLIARFRHDVGQSFVSFLATDRQNDGGGYNRVLGPDFLWRPGSDDSVKGQYLYSESETPNRPDLAEEWNGQKFSSHAAQLEWNHSTRHVDWYTQLIDRGTRFRADLGFVPQVDTREAFGMGGYTWRPEKGFFSKVRAGVTADYTGARNGDLVYRFVAPGVSFEGRWGTSAQVSYSMDRIRAGDRTIERAQVHYELSAQPSGTITEVGIEGRFGSDIDFQHSREGSGGEIGTELAVQATRHLEFRLDTNYRTLDIDGEGRLFTARVERLKATYNFSARSFLRLIGEHVRTDYDPTIFQEETPEHEGGRTISALYAWKLNWQTLVYLGYGDARALDESNAYQPYGRSAFVKVSYAWQR